MQYKTHRLRDAVVFALLVGSGIGMANAQTAPATADKDSKAKTLDTLVVTGSRIRQVDVETSQPVTFITRDDIEKQG
ncbi:MAG: hypothetical protein KGL91_10435, partial [Xanthomonadaceae bacterium]|nr:hypothetical protein [Xanthomonadaceae bacterium]